MARNGLLSEEFWNNFHGPNIAYLEEQYELYEQNPGAVEPSIKEVFDTYGAPHWITGTVGQDEREKAPPTYEEIKKITSAIKFVEAIRRYGHLEADIYPVGTGNEAHEKIHLLDQRTYGLTDEDLKSIPATWIWESAPPVVKNGLDVVNYLKNCYTGTISYEYDHVNQDRKSVV